MYCNHPSVWQGVRSRRNVCELHRFMKNHIHIYVQTRPRSYENHLLNLLKSSIPDSIKTPEKMCQTFQWHLLKTQLRISQFLKIDE